MTDSAQRLAAVDPRRSVIVQAPAGSGKTTLLVERFLRLLGSVEAPEEILAITFTRKAAAEMRERVLRFLQPGFSTDQPHEQAAAKVARTIAGKVERWNLAASPDRLMIRTIDSFSHSLARAMPVASRLGPVPEPADNNAALYRRAARRVLDALEQENNPGPGTVGAEVGQLLLWRDHRAQDIEDLLVALLGKREQWLRALALTGRPDREALEQVLSGVVAEALRAARACLDAALAAVGASGEEVAGLLAGAAETLAAQGRSSQIGAWAGCRTLPAPNPEALEQWRGLADAFLTQQGAWRKSVTIRNGFAPKTPQKERFESLLAALADNDALAERLHRARGLPVPRYRDDEWRTLEALIRVLERAAAELELVFAEAGQTDFTGLSRAALQGLGDEDSGVTDLGLYLDRRISHILVDEYQDTNWAQYHLLEKLTHGWQPGDGRTLFVVGDPMQSIYRFREAEVGLFMRTRDHGLNGLELESLTLSRNFRSAAEIVGWVNDTLGPAFPVEEDIAAGAVAYSASEPARGHGGRVELLARPDRGAEADAVAERVARALAEHAADPEFKAAIIVRARSHLDEILPALSARGIAFRAVKLDALQDRPVVQDLLALTRAIRFAADRGALLAVLRAPLCGLTLADLHRLAGDGADPFDTSALDRLPDAARRRAERVYEALDAARQRIGRRSLTDRVAGAWQRLGGPQAIERSTTEQAEAQLFFDTLENAEQHGLIDNWLDFEELLAAQHTEGDAADEDVRLEILTMHGAKGLEWDLVVLPALDRPPRANARELLYWLPLTPESGGEQVLLSPLRAAWQPENTALVELIRAEQAVRDGHERRRLLYVAATRARQQLIVSGGIDTDRDDPRPGTGSLMELIWPRAGGAFVASLEKSRAPAPEHPEAEHAPANLPDQALRRIPDDWQPPLLERLEWRPELPPLERAVEIEFNWAGMQARRAGTVLHALLEQVGRLGVENLAADRRRRLIESIPRQLRALGSGPEGLADSVAAITAAFERTLDSDTGRWILSGRHSESACELPLSGRIEGRLVNAVIDRTFIDETGTRWIIDYKSGYHAGGDLEGFLAEEAGRYETQLGLYRRLFELIGETNIKTALYLPRHVVLREV